MRNLMHNAAVIFRLSGDAVNFGILGIFAWATFALKAAAVEQYRAAGPLPSQSLASLAEMAGTNPFAVIQYWHLVAAWGLGIAAAGCGWMTVLGSRWAYHFILRVLNY